ncbi:MAG: serine/threonine-protein kinase, partial [Planctomycetota bacterium]
LVDSGTSWRQLEVLVDRSDEERLDHVLDAPSHPEMLGRIGDYDVEREIGRGGMGVVFKAFDTELNRPLAIKTLAPRLAEHGAARQRFAREAQAAAAVLHPNVIAIYGVNVSGKTPYLVMPFVAGPSLQRLVDERGPLEEKEIVRIAMQVSAALSAAHAQGLVHRDIKPANILVEADVSRVLVTDFGLARAIEDASATRSGYFAGTPNYMSPEQARGERVDGRSDLFSLGSAMYFMATGRLPFRADSPLCVLHRIVRDEPTPVRQVNSDVSGTLADVIAKLHEKASADRFSSAGELHEVLEQYLMHLHQPDVSKLPVIRSSARRQRLPTSSASKALLFAGIAAIALLSAFAWGKGWFGSPIVDEGVPQASPPSADSLAAEWNAAVRSNDFQPLAAELSQIDLEVRQLESLLGLTEPSVGEQ